MSSHAGDAAEACPDQEQRAADAAEQREVETAEGKRSVTGGRSWDGLRRRLGRRGLVIGPEGRRAERAVDVRCAVAMVQPPVIGQVSVDLLGSCITDFFWRCRRS